ncbi:hypothetical protein LLH03_17960 [bacterium]|nr:hypothetical protein [bacterium]
MAVGSLGAAKLGGAWALAHTRMVAARFLACNPLALALAAEQPKPEDFDWGRVEEAAWLATVKTQGLPPADVEVRVDKDLGYVTVVTWDYFLSTVKRYPKRPPTQHDAAKAAVGIFGERAGLVVDPKAVRVEASEPENPRGYTCLASGRLKNGRCFVASVQLGINDLRPLRFENMIISQESPGR